MKFTTLAYATLGMIGLLAAIVLPVALYRSGSAAVPLWTEAVSPGPLSAVHEFLGAQCEACHTPARGVEAVSCLTCHATAAPELLTKTSTTFHTNIGECASCHVEHQGRDRRPINMDHAVLTTVGHARAAEAGKGGAREADSDGRHALAQLQALLADSGADFIGGSLSSRAVPTSTGATLACAACHASRDPHQTLFGSECQNCHTVQTWTVATFQHPSPRSQDCVQCHQAPPSHYMMHFKMMDRAIAGQANARVEQCFLCHQTDAWNNVRGVGWRDMH